MSTTATTTTTTPAVKVTFFQKIESWFKKVFKELPSWNVTAASALNIAAPLLETIVTLTAGAPAEAAVQAVISKVQTDLGTAAVLIQTGVANPTLKGALTDIQTNLPQILAVAPITDPATTAKITDVVNVILGEVQAIAAALPATA